MSIQAGVWNFDGRPADRDKLRNISHAVSRYAPDSENTFLVESVGMLFRAFHTTQESRRERQPFVSSGGHIVTWDGRLDNREDLISQLERELGDDNTDVAIVAAAFERWGIDSLNKLIGDWALSLWDPADHSLTLARDYVGIRHLYYQMTQQQIIWCTHLVPLVLSTGGRLTLNDEYVAGFLAMEPDAHLSPYREILAVPPGSVVKIRNNRVAIHPYGSFDGGTCLRYKTDAEYEEHFRHVFRQAVRRRLRSDSPILADLSGGLDSSSIVCMADDILASEGAQTPRMETISAYDLTEPDEDDYSYFTRVEEQRGRVGFHIDMASSGTTFNLEYPDFLPTPGFSEREEVKHVRCKIIERGGYRVSLSGTGGDELVGNATDPRVHMADLVLQRQFHELSRQLMSWSMVLRRPWIQIFLQVLVQLLPISLRGQIAGEAQLEPWLDRAFARRYHFPVRQLGQIGESWRRLPSRRDSIATVAFLAQQMSQEAPSIEERRYPYLDWDLVQFLTSIPREQLIRPGERRSLMRRALVNHLPPEVLSRQTKAGAGRCYILTVGKHWDALENILGSLSIARLGYVHPVRFRQALLALKNGSMPPHVVRLLRALSLELWLRDVTRRGILTVSTERLLSSGLGLTSVKRATS